MTSDLQNGQSKVDILTRHGIPLDLGDRQFRVKPRTMTNDRQWLEAVFAKVTHRIAAFMGEDLTVAGVIAALGDSPADMLDLIVEYDETQQLPPREWIEANAFTQQITTAFTTLLAVAYPPFDVSRRLLPADRTAAIIGALLSYVIERATKDSSSELTATPSQNGATGRHKKSTTLSPMASSSS